MKVAMSVHSNPANSHIVRHNPVFNGNKEMVVKQMQRTGRNILEAWCFKDEIDLSQQTQ
jgi:hypothetical protein